MADPAFEEEARRQGQVVRNRHLLAGGPLLLLIALFLGSLFFIPVKARLWVGIVFVPAICVGFIYWNRFIRRLYPELPTVRCPTCGGVARVDEPYGTDTHFYLVCTQCGQRADTKFGSQYPIYASGK
jgi:hypothetical protein